MWFFHKNASIITKTVAEAPQRIVNHYIFKSAQIQVNNTNLDRSNTERRQSCAIPDINPQQPAQIGQTADHWRRNKSRHQISYYCGNSKKSVVISIFWWKTNAISAKTRINTQDEIEFELELHFELEALIGDKLRSIALTKEPPCTAMRAANYEVWDRRWRTAISRQRIQTLEGCHLTHG